jgi:hypothetical protein
MDKILRFLKNVLVVVFIAVLGLSYYELSNKDSPVTLCITADKIPIIRISVEYFFYIPMLFIIVFNIIISLWANVFRKFPLDKLPNFPNKKYWLAKKEDERTKHEQLRKIFVSWVYGFGVIINAFVSLLVGKLWFVNRSIGGELWEYQMLSITLIVLILLWIAYLFYRLSLKREEFFTSSEGKIENDDDAYDFGLDNK